MTDQTGGEQKTETTAGTTGTDQGQQQQTAQTTQATTQQGTQDAQQQSADKGILGSGEQAGGEQKQTIPADWPEAWRDKTAEGVKPGDPKFRQRLDRFGSPVDMAKSYFALEQRVSSGELKAIAPFPEKGDDAAKGAWRKEAGVPEKPENYSTELPGGVKFDDSDKPVLDNFLKVAHASNWSQQQVTQTLQSFHGIQKQQADQIAELDSTNRQKSEDTLRAEWGPQDYRRNVNAIDNLISTTMPADLSQTFLAGRLADGTKVADHPGIIKWLHSLSVEYPSLVPPTNEQVHSTQTRLEEIRTIVRNDPDAYQKNPKLQQEQIDLIARQSKAQGRAA